MENNDFDDLEKKVNDLNDSLKDNMNASEKVKEASVKKEKETEVKTKAARKNLEYKKYIVPRIFLAIQTGFTSEIAFYLGRKSTEDGIRKHIEDS